MPTIRCPSCDVAQESPAAGKPVTCLRCGHAWKPAAARPSATVPPPPRREAPAPAGPPDLPPADAPLQPSQEWGEAPGQEWGNPPPLPAALEPAGAESLPLLSLEPEPFPTPPLPLPEPAPPAWFPPSPAGQGFDARPPARRSRGGPVVGAGLAFTLFAVVGAVVYSVTRPGPALNPAPAAVADADKPAPIAAGPTTPTGGTPPRPVAPAVDPAAEVEALRAVLRAGSGEEKVAAVRRLGELKAAARRAVPELLDVYGTTGFIGQVAVGNALDAIGPPDAADGDRIAAALAPDVPPARLYAARTFAAHLTAPASAAPALVGHFASADRRLKLESLKAVGRIGPDARPAALGPLLDRLADADPEAARAAAAALKAVGPPAAADYPAIRERLTPRSGVETRRAAAALLAPVSHPAAEAVALWKPLLADPDAALRLRALDGLAPAAAGDKTLLPDVRRLLADDAAAVRGRAVAVVLACGPDAATAVDLDRAAADDRDADVRAAAAAALATLDLARPADLPRLRKLAADDKAEATRLIALAKIAALGPAARPAADELLGYVTDPSAPPTVRREALRAVAAAGSADPDKTAAALKLLARNKTSGPAALRTDAVDALGRTGAAGVRALIDLLDPPPEDGVRAAVIGALGRLGRGGEAAVAALYALSQDATWGPPATDALARIGGPYLAKRLLHDADAGLLYANGKLSSATRPAVRQWVAAVLGRLDPKELDAETNQAVLARLKAMQVGDKDIKVRYNASVALESLRVQTTAPKK